MQERTAASVACEIAYLQMQTEPRAFCVSHLPACPRRLLLSALLALQVGVAFTRFQTRFFQGR